MFAFVEGAVFSWEKTKSGQPRVYRVLYVSRQPFEDRRVIFIEIPQTAFSRGKESKRNYFVCGFRSANLRDLTGLVVEEIIKEALPPQPPARWTWSNQQILEACKPRRRVFVEQPGVWTSPDLLKRDTKWRLIEPLVSEAASGDLATWLSLDVRVVARASDFGIGAVQARDALHRFYAFGGIKNTLLPNTPDSGRKGESRYGKNGVRLGRPNAAAAVGNFEQQGKVCDTQDRQNLQDGYAMYVRPGCNVGEAFIATSAVFYSEGLVKKHGLWVPQLLPAKSRPTEREFRYHGPKGGDKHEAVRRLMGEGDWAKNHRGLIGSARDGIPVIGLVSSLDASPIDVNLTAAFDRLCPIGVGRGLFVREAFLGLYLGWHIAIGGLGTDAAKLAMLRAATDKGALLRRLGLEDLPEEDFPFLFSTRFMSDNGELRSSDGIGSCVEQLGACIEFVRRGRADLNSISESGHHVRHRRFDHHMQGTTRGRATKRGEALPITKALLTQFEYERLLALWVHWANTRQRVPHLVPTEMRRMMNRKSFEPTRIAIYRWAKEVGYVVSKPIDPRMLQAHLLPSFNATVRRNGLILHRPGTGDAVKLLHNAHFNDRYLAEAGLYRSFGRYEPPHISVKADPNDLSRVLLIDERGIHEIPNVTSDVILVHEAGIADLCAQHDQLNRERIDDQSAVDQDLSDQRAFRQETEEPARKQKAAAVAERGRPAQQGTKRSSVRANQAKEKDQQLDDALDRVAKAKDIEFAVSKSASADAPAPEAKPTTVIDINALLKSKLSKFHHGRLQ